MKLDAKLDRALWEDSEAFVSGSSYAYFWRDATGIRIAEDALKKKVRYAQALKEGKAAMIMDINCEDKAPYTGDFADHAWQAHPSVGRVNVGFVDGSVTDGDGEELILRPHGTEAEELTWFAGAHKLR